MRTKTLRCAVQVHITKVTNVGERLVKTFTRRLSVFRNAVLSGSETRNSEPPLPLVRTLVACPSAGVNQCSLDCYPYFRDRYNFRDIIVSRPSLVLSAVISAFGLLQFDFLIFICFWYCVREGTSVLVVKRVWFMMERC